MLGKNFAPLAEKLSNVEWGEFLLKDLFEKLNLKFKRKKFDKRFDISQEPTEEFSLPLVNAKDGNNGIMYYGREKDWEFAEMTIDIVNDGAVSTANVYTQPQKTGVLYNAYLIKPKFKSTVHLLNFFATSIFKSIKHKFSYEYKASWDRVSQEKIFLPTKDGEIDFEFMEKFITELEAERIAELEAYLSAAGLKDFVLTEEEKFALENLNSRSWQKFLLKDLFGESTRGKRLKSDDRIEGNLPFVTAGETDEGISAYIENEVKIFSKNTITIDMFGSAKYRNYNYGADDHIAVVHTEKISKFASIFVTAAIHKSSHNGQFHYGRNFYAKDADSLEICLPTKDGEIDYEFMEKFITAVQKIIIADVVKYSEEKISAYRQAANK